jgi:hypothetical protein
LDTVGGFKYCYGAWICLMRLRYCQ